MSKSYELMLKVLEIGHTQLVNKNKALKKQVQIINSIKEAQVVQTKEVLNTVLLYTIEHNLH